MAKVTFSENGCKVEMDKAFVVFTSKQGKECIEAFDSFYDALKFKEELESEGCNNAKVTRAEGLGMQGQTLC